MNELLKAYASVSISAALLTILLILFRPLYRQRFSKRWQYYIWLIVVARFLIPWNPGNGVVGHCFQQAQTALCSPADIAAQEGISQQSLLQNTEDVLNDAPKDHTAENNGVVKDGALTSSARKAGFVLQAVWLLTALVFIVRRITVYQSFLTYLKAGCVPVEDIKRLELFGTLAGQNHIRCVMGLYTNGMIASPLLAGLIHPNVILTNAELSDREFYYTVLHELTHFKRGDLFYQWLVQVTVCLHWFNPFVYLMAYEVSRMCELSCDEAVADRLDYEGRRAYGDTLLHAMRTGGIYHPSCASMSFGGGKQLLKERLDEIMKLKKRSKKSAAAAFAAALTLAASAVAAGAYIQPAAAEKIQASKTEQAYADIGITKKNGAYYYKGSRIRIFMDQRIDQSFVNFQYDKKGKKDVRLQRAQDYSITSVSFLSKEEAEEILEDLEAEDKNQTLTLKKYGKDADAEISVERLARNELPKKIKEAIGQCKDSAWYLIKDQDRTYIYYHALAKDYAFEPVIRNRNAKINIIDMNGNDGEVLLAVSTNMPLTITYQQKKVPCQKIDVKS